MLNPERFQLNNLGNTDMAKPSIPPEKPIRRAIPDVPDPIPVRIKPVPDLIPVEPDKTPRVPVPAGR